MELSRRQTLPEGGTFREQVALRLVVLVQNHLEASPTIATTLLPGLELPLEKVFRA